MNVLFLCTGNSARSILAEKLLERAGGGRCNTYSAGSQPTGTVNPWAVRYLEREGIATGDLRSKHWSEFAAPNAPAMDLILTVCDSAAGETCPVWPGKPISAHWGIPDPAAVRGTAQEQMLAFEQAAARLSWAIRQLLTLDLEMPDRTRFHAALNAIGRQIP